MGFSQSSGHCAVEHILRRERRDPSMPTTQRESRRGILEKWLYGPAVVSATQGTSFACRERDTVAANGDDPGVPDLLAAPIWHRMNRFGTYRTHASAHQHESHGCCSPSDPMQGNRRASSSRLRRNIRTAGFCIRDVRRDPRFLEESHVRLQLHRPCIHRSSPSPNMLLMVNKLTSPQISSYPIMERKPFPPIFVRVI